MTEQTAIQTAPETAPAPQRALTPLQVISQTLDTPEMTEKIEASLSGTGVSAARFKKSALAFLSRPESAYVVEKCDRGSIYAAVMNIATLGLDLNPLLGQVAIVPRGGKATVSVQYKGWIALGLAHPAIGAVNVGIIHEKDQYEIIEGTTPEIVVRPKLGDRGAPIAYYAVTVWAGGAKTFTIMTKEEVETHRNTFSEAWKSGGKSADVWKRNFDAMALKTVVLREKRCWPISVGVEDDEDVIEIRPVPMRDITPADGEPAAESPAPRGRGSRLAAFAAGE